MTEETSITPWVGEVVTAVDVIHTSLTGTIEAHYTVVDLVGWHEGNGLPRAGDDATAVQWVPWRALGEVGPCTETLAAVVARAVAMVKAGLIVVPGYIPWK